MNNVILLEFNELSPILMHRFMAQGKLPNFERFYNEASVYSTEAGEEAPNLEPWIQWVTVHSGLTFAEHGIFHLGDGHKLKEPCVWDILSQAGYRSAICGSMNIRYDQPFNGYILPDPWTTGAVPYPESLIPYFKFVQRNVQEYTNNRVPLTFKDYAQFMYFMLTHGLSFSTVKTIVQQLLSERGGKQRWKRAQILDKLQFDVFRWTYRTMKPHFSTFFLNSTAHLQHMYWRNMEPEHFKIKPTAQEQAEFENAILFGYQEMDKLVGQFLKLAAGNTTLVFATAFSQQPCLKYEELGGKSFYRPRQFDDLLTFAGVSAPHTVSPVMSEQFHVYFEDELEAREAEQRLRALRIGDVPALSVERKGKAVFTGCSIYQDIASDALLASTQTGASQPFFSIFYKVEGKKSGMHHPDGMLWIRGLERKHAFHPEKVPLTFIFPTLLDMFGLSKPAPAPRVTLEEPEEALQDVAETVA